MKSEAEWGSSKSEIRETRKKRQDTHVGLGFSGFIWKRRNDFIFTGLDCLADECFKQTLEASVEWHQANLNPVSSSVPNQSGRSSRKWKPPDRDHLKCNIDGSWVRGSNKSGIGWNLRDYKGDVMHYGAKSFPGLVSPLHTEATALVWLNSCLITQGYQKVCFESDCQDLIKALNNPEEWPSMHSFTSEILKLCNDVSDFSFGFSYRECNKCADAMAKYITHCQVYFDNLDVCPSP